MKSWLPLYIILFILLRVAFANAQGNSLLWRISGNSLHQPSYLYGTMHSTDSRVFHFADSVLPVLEQCEAFAMEVVLDEATQATLFQNIFMKEGNTLKTFLTEAQYDSLQEFAFQNAGVSISYFDRMKPLYVAMVLEMMSSDDSILIDNEPFLDQFLEKSATDQQKKVIGLETVEEQMCLFDVMTYKDQAQLLMKSVRDYSDDTTAFAQMVQYYLNNDLYNMMSFENDFELPDSLYRALFTDRNSKMARRIDSMIREQSIFIAVGAGHLGGDEGLVELLRNKGYTVIPVIPTYDCYEKDGWYLFYSLKNHFECSFPSRPLINRETNDTMHMFFYSSKTIEGSLTEEAFTVMVLSVNMNDSEIKKLLSEKGLTVSSFEQNAEREYILTYQNTSRMEGNGKVIQTPSNTYILLYSSRHKLKNKNRFFESFVLKDELRIK